MNKKGAVSILASFVTLKVLNDTRKYNNSYQILAEFIKHIISIHSIYSFSAIEMKNYLNQIFGFSIPEAVIKTALKNIGFVTKAEHIYNVDTTKVICDTEFVTTQQNAEFNNLSIIDSLTEYIKSKEPYKVIDEQKLTQDFIAFLLDDHQNSTGCYIDLIGEFILKNEKDSNLQQSLRAIEEGSIIYIGLNHNINETGSVTKKLTLYLGTEVLFSLVGFNGEIHKQLANDFFNQVRIANSNGIRINLRYFSEVKDEIDNFFDSAELIIEGKSQLIDTVAMKAIIKNCASSSDVKVKKSDFYHDLKKLYGIIADEYSDYYHPDNNQYNLESMIYTEAQQQNAWRFISHINKRRKGKTYTNYTEAEYLFVTNTKLTISASKEQTEKNRIDNINKNIDIDVVDYAVTLSKITNILWFKLGGCFGKNEYPTNINSILRARIVLAASLSYNVTDMYNKIKEQHANGEITDEQLAARIITLREKTLLPEELEGDSIEDIMDFSAEYISRFEEEFNRNKAEKQEQQKEMKSMQEHHEIQMKEKENEIIAQRKIICEQNNKNKELSDTLALFQEKEKQREEKQKKIRNIILFSLKLTLKISIIIIITIVAILLEKKYESNIPVYVCGILDIIAIVSSVRSTLKKDISKYFSKNPNS